MKHNKRGSGSSTPSIARVEAAVKAPRKPKLPRLSRCADGEQIILTPAAKKLVDDRFFKLITAKNAPGLPRFAKVERLKSAWEFLKRPLEAGAEALARHLYVLDLEWQQATAAAAAPGDPRVKEAHSRRAGVLHRDFLTTFGMLERYHRGGTQRILIQRVDQAAIVVGGVE